MEFYFYRYGLGVITFLYEGILSDRLYKLLREHIKDPSTILSSLLYTEYKSFMIESDKFLTEIHNEKNSNKRKMLVEKYKHDFYYMGSGYGHFGEVDESYIEKHACETLKHKTRVRESDTQVVLSDDEQAIVDLLHQTEILRDKRKQLATIGSYALFCFLHEGARRAGIDPKEFYGAWWFEYEDLITKPSELRERVKKRDIITVILKNNETQYLEYDALQSRVPEDKGAKEVSGTPASKGIARGQAKIILGVKDFNTFESGSVLITEMTRPEFVPLMKKAIAIVTDEGGLMSHAAIVSRELGIPCIVGTRNSTRVFKDADMVEVDTTKGIVRKV